MSPQGVPLPPLDPTPLPMPHLPAHLTPCTPSLRLRIPPPPPTHTHMFTGTRHPTLHTPTPTSGGACSSLLWWRRFSSCGSLLSAAQQVAAIRDSRCTSTSANSSASFSPAVLTSSGSVPRSKASSCGWAGTGAGAAGGGGDRGRGRADASVTCGQRSGGLRHLLCAAEGEGGVCAAAAGGVAPTPCPLSQSCSHCANAAADQGCCSSYLRYSAGWLPGPSTLWQHAGLMPFCPAAAVSCLTPPLLLPLPSLSPVQRRPTSGTSSAAGGRVHPTSGCNSAGTWGQVWRGTKEG